MTKPTERFERASFFERQLTARQKQILDFIVDGRTNGEIGTALGITLDGAKWNVSEILTKLGLADREEAASYWRWRKRRRAWHATTNFARGMIAAPVLKWAAGSAVAVGVVGAGIGGLVLLQQQDGGGAPSATATDEPTEPAEPTEPGTRIVTSVMTQTDSAGVVQFSEDSTTWYRDPDTVRCEMDSTTPRTSAETVQVREGSNSRSVRTHQGSGAATVMFQEQALQQGWVPCGFGGITNGIEIGLTIDEYVAALTATGMGVADLLVGDEEQILGSAARLMSWTSETTGPPEPGAPVLYATTARVWFSEELGMVLRAESTDSQGDTTAYEVTSVEVDKQLDAGLFVLDQPADATVIPTAPIDPPYVLADGSTAPYPFRETPGFLRPIGQPDPWRLVAAYEPDGGSFPMQYGFDSGHGGDTARIWLTLHGPDIATPPGFTDAPEVAIGEYTARMAQDPDGTVRLAWQADGSAVTVTLWQVDLATFQELFPLMFAVQPTP